MKAYFQLCSQIVKPISLDILLPMMILFYHVLLLHVVLIVLVKEGFFIELESAVLRLGLQSFLILAPAGSD